jgi:molecular chaperone GrpE
MSAAESLATGEEDGSNVGAAVSAAVRQEFDAVLPHVLAALKRDRAFDELSNRLNRAERRLETRKERPMAVAVHRLLNRVRHLDFDAPVKQALEADLIGVLREGGLAEFGAAGDDYDPAQHEALEGSAVDGQATVAEVLASGLESAGDIILRAQVRIDPRSDPPPQPADPMIPLNQQTKDGS